MICLINPEFSFLGWLGLTLIGFYICYLFYILHSCLVNWDCFRCFVS